MTVNRYLFQSPSASQVQVGRPDPSVKQEDTKSSQELEKNEKSTSLTNETQLDSISSSHLLDVYA